jgi:hypothetical protein
MPIQPGAAMGPHHDEIDVVFVDVLEDGLVGRCPCDEPFDRVHPGCLRSLDHRIDRVLTPSSRASRVPPTEVSIPTVVSTT